jgi:hypothetical protein
MAFFLLRGRFWLSVLKVFLLGFVAMMIVIQIPEMRYDLGSKDPVRIESPAQLDSGLPERAVFASIRGHADFERAFVYQRYGLAYTYFTLDPYGLRMVVRTYEKVDRQWEELTRFVGRLRPFDDQPFSYRVEEIFQEQFQATIPEDAYFLALYDVPKLSGWQLGGVIFAAVVWAVMFYFFFFFKPRKRPVSFSGDEYPEQRPGRRKRSAKPAESTGGT